MMATEGRNGTQRGVGSAGVDSARVTRSHISAIARGGGRWSILVICILAQLLGASATVHAAPPAEDLDRVVTAFRDSERRSLVFATEHAWRPVLATQRRTADSLRALSIDGAVAVTLTTTDEHPFYEAGRGWVPSARLAVGSRLLAADYGPGAGATLRRSTPARGPATVFNLSVDEPRNYYVSSARILVHNKDVALGLYRNGQGGLPRFADEVDGVPYWQWLAKGLVPGGTKSWGTKFHYVLHNTINKGGRIKFNLTGLDLDRALGTPLVPQPGKLGMTNWELRQIMGNKRFFEATDFYLDGRLLTPEEAAELGVRFIP